MKILVLGNFKDISLNQKTLNILSNIVKVYNDTVIDLFVHSPIIFENKLIKVPTFVNNIFILNNKKSNEPLNKNSYAIFLKNFIEKEKYSHIFSIDSNIYKNILPMVSAMLNVNLLTKINGFINFNTFTTKIYSEKISVDVTNNESYLLGIINSHCLTNEKNISEEKREPFFLTFNNKKQEFIELLSSINNDLRNENLSTSKIVIAGGKGLETKENFDILYSLANKINAVVGASRSAIYAGFADNSIQIGQTGKIINPDLYLAFGISGAPQHISGILNAKKIIAINKNKNAPIFKFSDYGLIDDAPKVLNELCEYFVKFNKS